MVGSLAWSVVTANLLSSANGIKLVDTLHCMTSQIHSAMFSNARLLTVPECPAMHRAEELVAEFDAMLGLPPRQQEGQPKATLPAPCLAVAGLSGSLRSLCLLLSKLRAPLRSLELVSPASNQADQPCGEGTCQLMVHASVCRPGSPVSTAFCRAMLSSRGRSHKMPTAAQGRVEA